MGLITEFNEYFVDWKRNLDEDEDFDIKFKNRILENIKPFEAFELIPEAVELVLSQKEKFLCDVAFFILSGLVIKSETTEMNKSLLQNWEKLESHMSSFGEYYKREFLDLKRWFRIK